LVIFIFDLLKYGRYWNDYWWYCIAILLAIIAIAIGGYSLTKSLDGSKGPEGPLVHLDPLMVHQVQWDLEELLE
jgi:hypothetical protein